MQKQEREGEERKQGNLAEEMERERRGVKVLDWAVICSLVLLDWEWEVCSTAAE